MLPTITHSSLTSLTLIPLEAFAITSSTIANAHITTFQRLVSRVVSIIAMGFANPCGRLWAARERAIGYMVVPIVAQTSVFIRTHAVTTAVIRTGTIGPRHCQQQQAESQHEEFPHPSTIHLRSRYRISILTTNTCTSPPVITTSRQDTLTPRSWEGAGKVPYVRARVILFVLGG